MGQGGGSAKGQAEPATPEPPKLPDTASPELKDFVDCKGESATLDPANLDWLGLPRRLPKPTVTMEHGARRGTVDITVDFPGLDPWKMTGEVRDGQLHLDTSQVPETMLGVDIRARIDEWVRQLNEWMKHRGRAAGEFRLRRGKLTVAKAPRQAGMAPAGQSGWTTRQKAAAGVGGVALVAAIGVGAFALTSDGNGGGEVETEAPSNGNEVTVAPATSEDLQHALLGVGDLPAGFAVGEPLPADFGEGEGLCNGPGEAAIVPPAGRAGVQFTNEPARQFAGEVLFSFEDFEQAAIVLDEIETQGSSCTSYETMNEDSDQQFLVDIAPTDVQVPDGWDQAVAFVSALRPVTQPSTQPFVQYLAYTQTGGVLLAVNGSSFDDAEAGSLMEQLLADAATRADDMLTLV